jgi:hypothetical protein
MELLKDDTKSGGCRWSSGDGLGAICSCFYKRDRAGFIFFALI